MSVQLTTAVEILLVTSPSTALQGRAVTAPCLSTFLEHVPITPALDATVVIPYHLAYRQLHSPMEILSSATLTGRLPVVTFINVLLQG